jgi:hypothetical protein
MADAIAMSRLVRLAGVAVMMTLAACGSNGKSSQPNSTTVAPGAPGAPVTATKAACALITQADATKLFGYAAKSKKADNSVGADSACVWEADTNPDPSSIDDISYLLQIRVYDSEQAYNEQYMANPKSLPGIGDKAFTNVQGPRVQAEFVKDGKTVLIEYSINAIAADPKPKASDQQDEIVALAGTAAGRL